MLSLLPENQCRGFALKDPALWVPFHIGVVTDAGTADGFAQCKSLLLSELPLTLCAEGHGLALL